MMELNNPLLPTWAEDTLFSGELAAACHVQSYLTVMSPLSQTVTAGCYPLLQRGS